MLQVGSPSGIGFDRRYLSRAFHRPRQDAKLEARHEGRRQIAGLVFRTGPKLFLIQRRFDRYRVEQWDGDRIRLHVRRPGLGCPRKARSSGRPAEA